MIVGESKLMSSIGRPFYKLNEVGDEYNEQLYENKEMLAEDLVDNKRLEEGPLLVESRSTISSSSCSTRTRTRFSRTRSRSSRSRSTMSGSRRSGSRKSDLTRNRSKRTKSGSMSSS